MIILNSAERFIKATEEINMKRNLNAQCLNRGRCDTEQRTDRISVVKSLVFHRIIHLRGSFQFYLFPTRNLNKEFHTFH